MSSTDTIPEILTSPKRQVDTDEVRHPPSCTCHSDEGSTSQVLELRALLRDLLPFAVRGARVGLGEFGVRDGDESRMARAARLLGRIESGEFGPVGTEEPVRIANPKMSR